jgi:hypothetical protein
MMELALVSANIYTGNPNRPFAEAVLVRDGKIDRIGDDGEILAAAGKNAQTFILDGHLITPGLTDAHCHFLSFGNTARRLNLRQTKSIAEARAIAAEGVKGKKPGEWIIGRGWDHHIWPERRPPTRYDLDDLLPENPAMLVRYCGHGVWLNSLALQMAGITRDTPQPPGGEICRDPDTGEPTGLILDARHLIEAHIPPPTREEWIADARIAQTEALKHGLTGVHTCESLAEWEILHQMDLAGDLKIRVYHLLKPADLAEATKRGIRPGFGSERLHFGHMKLFADGSLGAGTALLHEPYTDEPDNSGIPFLDRELLFAAVEEAYRAGWDVAVHAIGDKAVTNALDAMEAGRQRHSGPRRDRLEHVQLFQPTDLPRFKDMDVTASVQPVFTNTDWHISEKRWGPDRSRYAYAWKSMMEAGVRVQFGSDTPVEPINPILGLRAAVLRTDLSGNPEGGWRPEQRLTLAEAIDGFTQTAAWTARRETESGRLVPGAAADLTAFAEDLFQLPPDRWPEVPVALTIVGGEVAYRME